MRIQAILDIESRYDYYPYEGTGSGKRAQSMLVIGATGDAGREVIASARRRTIPVTALVRRESESVSFPHDVETVVGDVFDEQSLATALAGHESVISCLGVRRGSAPGTVRSAGTAALVDAMKQAGVHRLVAVSSVGVGSSREAQSFPARHLWPLLAGRDRIAEASRAEEAIAASDLDWTIIRAPRLTNDPATGHFTVGEDLPLSLSAELTRADLAEILLDSTSDQRLVGKRVSAVSGA
jgi:putative NADH-flavin reductase